jgi:DNA-binding MarR family transcriptional regulator
MNPMSVSFISVAGSCRTMRSLAEEWQCDASNATLIVDRLERSGLAERRSMAGDARVRLVQLTAKGRRTQLELVEEFHTPPEELLALTANELDALRRILERIPATPETERGA